MANLKTFLFGERNRIGRRLIVLIIAFSSLITLVISALQLALEYRELRDGMDRQLDGVGIYVPSIAGSVWDFDEKQIRLALDALARLPNIDRVSVTTSGDRKQWMAGKELSPNIVTRTYSLRHEARGRETEIGTLEVVASLNAIYRQVAARALTILFSNGLKTFLVAIFMVLLFRRLVTDRLEDLARKANRLVPELLPLRQVVETEPQPIPGRLDELAAVDWTLDKTAENLGAAVTALQRLKEDLEQRVRDRTRELEELNKDLEAFGYSLSHDLRAPLRTMAAFSAILQEDYGDRLDQEGEKHLSRIVEAARRMDILIGDTLSLFRATGATLKGQLIDLSRIANDIVEQLVHSHPERAVEWNIEAGMTAKGDPGLMRTALENLIGNAWKYTGKRDVAQIAIGSFRNDGGCTTYFVKDNGAGFNMKYADRLFVPFQRLHGEAEFPGTGVGLATVQKIVHRHGGDIWAESAPDQGAKFFFTLSPARQGMPDQPTPAAS